MQCCMGPYGVLVPFVAWCTPINININILWLAHVLVNTCTTLCTNYCKSIPNSTDMTLSPQIIAQHYPQSTQRLAHSTHSTPWFTHPHVPTISSCVVRSIHDLSTRDIDNAILLRVILKLMKEWNTTVSNAKNS